MVCATSAPCSKPPRSRGTGALSRTCWRRQPPSVKDLRAYASWRLRDQNSLLVQGEWRATVNRFLEMALFVDGGTVSPRRNDLDVKDMKTDVGIGFRFHGSLATPLRIELTKGSEGFGLVFAASQVF